MEINKHRSLLSIIPVNELIRTTLNLNRVRLLSKKSGWPSALVEAAKASSFMVDNKWLLNREIYVPTHCAHFTRTLNFIVTVGIIPMP